MATLPGPNSTLGPSGWIVQEIGEGTTTRVTTSRSLTAADDGAALECDSGVNITVPAGLPLGFACLLLPSASTQIISSGGTLLNGSTSTLTASSATSVTAAIIGRVSAANSYVVSGV